MDEQKIRKDITGEIEHKKKSYDKVRNARIEYSKSMLRKYSSWKICFFFSNFSAILLFIISIYGNDAKLSLLSGVYSIYIILLQYTVNEFRYHEKSKLSSRNQLLIEEKIFYFKKLIRFAETQDNDTYLEQEYEKICSEYTKELEYFPNHSSKDYRLASLRIDKLKIIERKKELNPNDKKNNFQLVWVHSRICVLKCVDYFIPICQLLIALVLILLALLRSGFI